MGDEVLFLWDISFLGGGISWECFLPEETITRLLHLPTFQPRDPPFLAQELPHLNLFPNLDLVFYVSHRLQSHWFIPSTQAYWALLSVSNCTKGKKNRWIRNPSKSREEKYKSKHYSVLRASRKTDHILRIKNWGIAYNEDFF